MSIVKYIFSYIFFLMNYLVLEDNKLMVFYSLPYFSDNSRAVYEEMVNRDYDEKYKIVWFVDKPKNYKDKNSNIIFIKHRSIYGIWLFFRAKYIFTTHSIWMNCYIKRRQIFINLWHGMMIKKIGLLQHNNFLGVRRDYDLMPVTSDIYRIIASKTFGTSLNKNTITGLPRNDYLYNDKDILKKIGINKKEYKKVIIWMPTFRNNSKKNYGIPILNKKNIQILSDNLKKINVLLIIKLHQFGGSEIKNMKYIKILTDDIISKDIKLYNIIGETDCLLTDYSSVFIDYLNLNKPIGFVYDDLKEYKRTRGFIFNNIKNFLPGKHINSFKELIKFIKDIENEKDYFLEERKFVNKIFNEFNDDQNSSRFVDYLEKTIIE